MPRVMFSEDLGDFVKGFTAGSVIADSAQDNELKKKQLAQSQRQMDITEQHYKDIADYYRAKTGGNAANVFAGSPYMQDGAEKFGGSSYDPSKVPTFFNDITKQSALPDDFLPKSYWLESHFGQNTKNPNSTAGGHFQFTDGTAKLYGLRDKNDLRQSAEATARYAVHNRDVLKKVLGREPTGAELYLAHQQDGAKAAQLLRNPNTPATAIVGHDAVVNNGGRPDMTAGEFANMWIKKFNSLSGRPAPTQGALPMNVQPQPQAALPARGVDDAEDDFLQYGARGGMIRRYEDGGMVDQKPYYATDLMNDVGDALNRLPEVIGGALQGVQNMFGLNEQPAVASADPAYMNKVQAFARDEGAPPPQQVAEVRRKVDPNNELGEGLGTVYGMVKTYDYYLKQGDVSRARQAAGAIVLYSRSMTRQLGALAVQALEQGDENEALKAVKHAIEMTPTGQTLKVEGNKGIIVDQKTGRPVREFDINEGTLMNAAMGFTTGKAYYDDLMSFAKGELDPKYEQAGVKADAQITSAGIRANATENAANIRATSSERIAAARNKVTMDKTQLLIDAHSDDTDKKLAARKELAQMGIDATALENTRKYASNREIRQMMIDAHSADTDKRLAAQDELAHLGWDMKKFLKQMDIDADASLQDDKQDFQGEQNGLNRTSREAIATGNQATSRANTQDRIGAAAEQGAANRSSREGIAAGNQSTSRANTQDRIDAQGARQAVDLDARGRENAANRSSREGIAAGNQSTSRSNTQDRIGAAAEQGDKNRAVRRSEGSANRNAAMDRVTTRVGAQAEQGDKNRGAAMDRVKTRVGAAAEQGDKNRASRESEGQKNRDASMGRVERRMEGAGGMMTRRVTSRQHDAVEKMPDYEILGKEDGARVSASQAQATRTIAHGILESNRGFGRQGVDYARQLTAWDSANRRPLTRVKLNEGKDGYSVTMPDGVTLQLDEPTFRQVQRIHGAAAR